MHLDTNDRRAVASAIILAVAWVPVAWFLSGTDPTIPQLGMARATWIAGVCGIIVTTLIVIAASKLFSRFWLWAIVISALVGALAVLLLGNVGWNLAQEFEWITHGSADDTFAALLNASYGFSAALTLGVQGLWAIDLDERTIFIFGILGEDKRTRRPSLHAVQDTAPAIIPASPKAGS